jgi:hypothetical protein
VFVLWRALLQLAGGRAFTTQEVCAHALTSAGVEREIDLPLDDGVLAAAAWPRGALR